MKVQIHKIVDQMLLIRWLLFLAINEYDTVYIQLIIV